MNFIYSSFLAGPQSDEMEEDWFEEIDYFVDDEMLGTIVSEKEEL